ncbi:MAG: hypothetical protein HY067_00270 [Betaproteobacteria bacterium]|nr:hypothetical protein [Betaproteobacteria bacterium]
MQNGKTGSAMKRWIAILLCTPVLLPAIAHSQLLVNGGVEYFHWNENTTPEVKETGPMFTFGLAYSQEREAGALFAYRGKIWGGSVDYEGATLLGGTPLLSTTNYEGINNEVQVRWRKPGKVGGSLDGVVGLGLDLWRRELTSVQKEDYAIGYLRLGVESGADYNGQWSVGLGIKLPFWTYENAHLEQIGFDSNPILHPGKELSPFGSLGYRFTEKLQVTAYYDGFRFGKSKNVNTNEVATGQPIIVFQPASDMSIFGLKLEYRMR